MLFYRAALPLSSRALNFVARIIRRYREEIGSLWRRLDPGQQALLVLACLTKGETYPQVAAGFGVGTATAWRYVNETVDLLAARAPRLRTAAHDARKAGHARLRAPGERANAQLKSWGILRRARCCPASIGKLAKAIHVLQLQGTA